MKSADAGIAELQKHVDTLIVIPNQNLFLIANPNTTFKEAFEMADEVLQQGVRGITDLMVMPGLINLDFADVRSVMSEMGKAMMGTGEASGDNRAIEAAEKAIANPLLDGVSMKGAKGVIVSITGGEDMRLLEVDEAANHIKELVDPDANIIWGSAFNNDLEGKIRVSVVATGIEADAMTAQPAEPSKLFSFPPRSRAEVRTPGTGSGGTSPSEPKSELKSSESKSAAPELPPLVLTPPEEATAPAAEADDELELGEDMVAPEAEAAAPEAEAEPKVIPGPRRWLMSEPEAEEQPTATISAITPAAPQAREGATLFERMSSIARGSGKVQAEEDEEERHQPLDIPRFLNRQNNQ